MKANNSVTKSLLQACFWILAGTGRRFGGIRPHRLLHWIASSSYGDDTPTPEDFKVYRDNWGNKLLLHPHFALDYQIIAFGAYDAPLHRYIERHVEPGMVCLDVGANIGSVSLHLGQRVAPNGIVHCFEPVPHLIRRFNENLAVNDRVDSVLLHPFALCDRDGECTMGITDETTVNQGVGTLRNTGHVCLDKTISINTKTLDAFAEQNRLERLDTVKVDIQGCELEFIHGGRRTLERFKPDLLLEISPADLTAAGATGRELVQALDQFGYEVFELHKSGQVGLQIHPDQVTEAFSASNVVARHRIKVDGRQRRAAA